MANSLDIFRGNTKITTIDIDESTVFNAKLPGTELITCPIDTLQVLKLREEDYIIYQSAVYKIRILPDASKDSTKLAKSYNINFLARFYDLHDTYVQHLGSHVFPYYGTASDHLALLLGSANLNDTGWIAGAVDNTTPILLDYNWTFIRPALDMIAEAFGLEWNAVGTTVNMKASIGNNTGLTFELGRGKGLHQINRASDTSKEKINRVYGVGGTRNIDATYRNGEETNLVFQERYVETPGVTAGTERVREGKYENLDIYPHFEGVVANPQFTLVGGVITSATIQDLNIDFDLMLYLQDGVKPKVSFLTGPVTGVDFEISAFNFSTKTVTLIPFTDTSGYYFPSATSKPEIGDKFTFIDVRMPSAYIATWEAKLKTATTKFLNENKSQRINFSVELDEKHLRDNNIILKVGDRGTAIDADLDANEIVRFTEISYPIVNEFKVKGVIGNEIVYDKVAKLFADVLNNTKQIATVSAKGIVQAKRLAQDLRSLEGSIFDTEGMFDSDKFNVGVLTAVLGIFGVKSQNFVLSDVRMVDNVGGNPNAITISGGQLIHLEITNAGAGGDTWMMTSSSISSLLSSSFYYIYAKCSKVSQVGSWVITTYQIKPDDVPGFYHFLAGVIYPVNNGFRDSEFTYGITDITGNRIKTGIIAGRNGSVEINLETGTIKGDVTFTGSSLSNINNISSAANLGVANAATALGVANNAANAASVAQSSANTANTLLANIANDNILAASEKPDVLKEYNIIVGEVAIIEAQSNQYSISHSSYTNNYITLISYLNPLLSAMGSDDVINGATFRQYFTNYYNEKVSLLSAISVKAKQLADAAQNSASTAINNAQIVQNNLTAIQNSLGGLAYKSAVELAQLGSTVISGGYIKTSLIETNALIISGSLATQTYAVNQASGYSNSALASAQSYASSVATTAGNNALSAAQIYALTQINAIQIGGVNTFSSNTPIGPNGMGYATYIKNGTNGGYPVTNGIAAIGQPTGNGEFRIANVITSNGEWTVSGRWIANGPFTIYVDICDESSQGFTVQTYYTDFKFTVNVTNYENNPNVYHFVDFQGIPWVYFNITDLKIEKGNKATAWTLSQYDINLNAQNLSNSALSSAQSYADAKAVTTINSAQSYADSVATSKANIAQTAAISSASADATAKANAAQSAAVSASTSLINSIQVGGVNTFGKTTTGIGAFNGMVNGMHVPNTIDPSGVFIKNGVYAVGTAGATNGYVRLENTVTSNGTWTVSGEVSSNGTMYFSVSGCDDGGGASGVFTYNPSTMNTWVKFALTINISRFDLGGNTAYRFIDFYGMGYQYFRLQNLKIEKGNKATDYSPSIEDTQALITTAQATAQNAVTAYNNLTSQLKVTAFQDVEQWAYQGTTIVSGGYITTSLLNVGYIQVNAVTAGYINALDIVSKNIRTAESGTKRVEITQSTNSIIFYNAANEQLVRIDDNLAVESPGNAITPATYGAGIRIGQSGATTSLSRYGLSVTSPNGALYPKTFIGTVGSGYTGFASIDVEGGFNVKNLEHYFGGTGKGDFKLVAGNVLDYNGNQINVMLVVPL